MSASKFPGFRLGIYVFKDAEIVDFAAPHGVFSVARRFDPELDALRRDAAGADPGRLHRGAHSAAYDLSREDVQQGAAAPS